MSHPLQLIPPAGALITNLMKYLLTEYSIYNDGRIFFDPAFNTELFDSYVGALRWLVKERQVAARCGWSTEVIIPAYRDNCGRQQMLSLVRQSSNMKVKFTISRINTNGFH